jgi:hypothetical protein
VGTHAKVGLILKLACLAHTLPCGTWMFVMWFMDQQHQHPSGVCSKLRISDSALIFQDLLGTQGEVEATGPRTIDQTVSNFPIAQPPGGSC